MARRVAGCAVIQLRTCSSRDNTVSKFNTPRINSTSSVLRLCAASPLETRCLLPIALAPVVDRPVDITFCLLHQGGELGAIHLAKVSTVDRDIIHLPAGVAGFAQAVLHQVNLAGTAVDFLVDHGAVIDRKSVV